MTLFDIALHALAFCGALFLASIGCIALHLRRLMREDDRARAQARALRAAELRRESRRHADGMEAALEAAQRIINQKSNA